MLRVTSRSRAWRTSRAVANAWAASARRRRATATDDELGPTFPGSVVTHATRMEGGKVMSFESGRLARLTNGAVLARAGDAVVMCAATTSRDVDQASAIKGFVPLMVDYRERSYAKGKIPPTWPRREGAPKEREILFMRAIDRATRPLFAKEYARETMVQCVVMASDGGEDLGVLSINGVSAALMASSIPWRGPVGACRVAAFANAESASGDGYDLVVSPNDALNETADFTLFYAGNDTRALMIEAQANRRGIPEAVVARVLRRAHEAARELLPPQIELAAKIGKPKTTLPPAVVSKAMKEKMYEVAKTRILALYEEHIQDKHERGRKMAELQSQVIKDIGQDHAEWLAECQADNATLGSAYFQTCARVMRERVLAEGVRVDGRGLRDLRALDGVAGGMPIVHGSALFERGNTQALATVTLGSMDEMQKLDNLTGPLSKRLMLHYSFPSFSVNETGGGRGISRREVGHGALAEKSLLAVFPDEAKFPFAVRVNAETLESNGSSSMAAVCSGSMALMNAGVPISEHVGAISIGLVMDEDESTGEVKRYVLMDDIMGLEDVLGDMDFKIAGTRSGITGIQLDCKPEGIPLDILIEAMDRASEARQKVIDVMERAVSSPEQELKDSAPRYGRANIPSSLIGKLIGPQGSNIKALERDTGAKVSIINEEGELAVFGPNKKSFDAAMAHIDALKTSVVDVGLSYVVSVKEVLAFGVILEAPGGEEGLMHISEFAHERTENVSDVFKVGDEVEVKCIAKDAGGRVKWSRKALLPRGSADINDPETPVVDVGLSYVVSVTEVLPFGVILEAPSGEEGLMHISEFAHERTENASDVFKVGDEVEVKCIAKDAGGRVKWSRKALLPKVLARPPGREKPRFSVTRKSEIE